MQAATTDRLNQNFLDEYNSRDAILKYSTRTAGHGVNYLIDHDYAEVYDRAIAIAAQTSPGPLRLLEFGCGAGMNLIGLLTRLDRKGIAVEDAYGTDFSASLIESARREAKAFLPAALQHKASFHVARNERLSAELSSALGRPPQSLFGSFDLIFGVNTFRYCHRLHTAEECARDIHALLRPGGVCVMIDMNDKFPLFRSHLKRTVETPEERYLPSLDEYARPFERAGFDMLTKDRFCWIPHSAGPALTRICRVLTPVLNTAVRSRAMRSLVVARRPV